LGRETVHSSSGRINSHLNPVKWAQEVEKLGAGEILLTSIDREGTWEGFNLNLVRRISTAVNIPVIAHGGAGNLSHIREVVKDAGATAVALGSMVVFQKQGMGVLVNFPDKKALARALS
jgi:cyclase